MKQLSDRRLTAWQALLVSFLSSCTVIYVMTARYGVCFETNDDRIFSEIFSGVLTGTPNAYGIYINYLLGKMISMLYSITRSVQWYGVFLISCFVAIYTALMTVVLQECSNMLEQIAFWVFGCLTIVANVYIFALIQFTTVAGVLAVAGYFWLLIDKRPARRYIVFGLFECMAILLRQDSMLMVQPIGICVVIGFLIVRCFENREEFKSCLKELAQCILVIGVVTVFAQVGNYVIGDYSSEEWKAYTEYNTLNVQMADYYGYPEYEQCKDILKKYNITEAEYQALKRYVVLDNKFAPEFMTEISNLARKNYETENPFSLIRIAKRLITYPKYDNCYGYEISVPVMYIAVGVLIWLSGQIRYMLPVMAVCGSKNLVFAYLIYRGRLPHRVVNILWVAELLFLTAIGVRVFLQALKKRSNKKIIFSIALIIAGALLYSAHIGSAIVQNKNLSKIYYADCLQQLFDYCAESESGVLLSDDVTTYYTGHVLDTKHYQKRESLVTGGWFSNSPMMDEAVETYRKEHAEGMKYITFSEEINVDNFYILKFFEETYGMKPELVDTFTIEELGLSYAVYQLY
ncbi:MAG: hypothetical protein IKK03_05820 [Lachnospiraceae bacterium]|nr:hypothetical protein [Lachnospiraceae bacterium]